MAFVVEGCMWTEMIRPVSGMGQCHVDESACSDAAPTPFDDHHFHQQQHALCNLSHDCPPRFLTVSPSASPPSPLSSQPHNSKPSTSPPAHPPPPTPSSTPQSSLSFPACPISFFSSLLFSRSLLSPSSHRRCTTSTAGPRIPRPRYARRRRCRKRGRGGGLSSWRGSRSSRGRGCGAC